MTPGDIAQKMPENPFPNDTPCHCKKGILNSSRMTYAFGKVDKP